MRTVPSEYRWCYGGFHLGDPQWSVVPAVSVVPSVATVTSVTLGPSVTTVTSITLGPSVVKVTSVSGDRQCGLVIGNMFQVIASVG